MLLLDTYLKRNKYLIGVGIVEMLVGLVWFGFRRGQGGDFICDRNGRVDQIEVSEN